MRGAFDQLTAPGDIGSGSSVLRKAASISGLTTGAVYQCRFVVSNSAGVTFGGIQLFTTGKKVAAWGDNAYGQTNVQAGLPPIIDVAGGYGHSQALGLDTIVRAWGGQYAGPGWAPVFSPGHSSVVMVAGEGNHCLSLMADGSVQAWGYNGCGQTSIPAGLTNAVAISGGGNHSLALTEHGHVVAWGAGQPNSSCFGSYGQATVPLGLSNVVAIAGGGNHSLALRANGTVAAWGDNSYLQTNVPVGLTNVVKIAAGVWHSLALKADGTVIAWGRNFEGQSTVPANLSNVVSIAAGFTHNLALLANGTVASWGINPRSSTPIPAGLTNVVNIACGDFHSIVLADNLPPQALGKVSTGLMNQDQTITLSASDPNNDPLTLKISSLPSRGTLYQYVAGSRGDPITNLQAVVIDSGKRLIFAPATDEAASPYTAFSFVANDGGAESASAIVTINVLLPAAPRFTWYGFVAGGAFHLHFSGTGNGSYSVWSSTNLLIWTLLGKADQVSFGNYEFSHGSAANFDRVFYRATAP